MKRKVMSAILALSMLVNATGWSALPALAEGEKTGNVTHEHEHILSQTKSSIENGNYFLDKDWLLKSNQTLRVTGDATICLNGHKIDVDGNSLQIIVLDGAKLTLCDCDDTLREGHLDASGLWHEGAAATGEVDMPIYGGVITGISSYLQLVSSLGEFYLESGNIAGNVIPGTAAIFKTQNQGKVTVNGGTCVGNLASIIKVDVDGSGKTDAGFGEINGGKIIQNHASTATIKNYGTLAVTGGRITGNQSDDEAGGIRNTSKATLQLSGNPLIKNNIGKDGYNNIYLEGKPIEITGALQSSASIGIGMATPGPFTKGWQTHMNGQAPSKYFSSDQTGYWVSEGNGEAILTNQKPELKAPAITKQPQSLTLTQGEDGTLSVEATAEEDATLSYQWYQATDATSTENGTAIDGAINASLTIGADASVGTTYYYCVVTASHEGESKTATSNIVTVTVRRPALQAPVIKTQPQDLNLKYGEGGTLSVEAIAEEGAELSYQWYQATDATSTENGTAIDGATNASLTIDKNTLAGTIYYYCIVTAMREGESKTVTSNIVTVTVQRPALQAPTIKTQPQDLNLKYGEGGTLSVEATAEQDATLNYQWYKTTNKSDVQGGEAIKDETTSTLSVEKDTSVGTSYYYCIVTATRDGIARSVTSDVATVTVAATSSRPSKPSGHSETNPDGSVTTTVTKPNGTVVATTKYPNGDCMILTTAPSGKVDVALSGTSRRLTVLSIEGLSVDTIAFVTDAKGTRRLEPCTAVSEKGLAIMVRDGDSIELEQKMMNFTDVPDTHWAKSPITYVAARDLLIGVDDTLFAPSMQTSRAMIWSILARLEGVRLEETTPWYASSQAWAMDAAISDGNNPNGDISREQLVTMLYRYANSPAVNGDLTAYSDGSQVSAWAVDAVRWAVEEGILNGITVDTLIPQGTATRAQTAAILERFIAWQLGVV